MKFLSRCVFLRTITSRCANESSGSISNVNIRSFMAITTNRRLALRKPHVFASAVCVYSSDNKKHFFNLEKKTGALKDVLEYKKEQLKDTEHRIRLRGEEIVRDIKQQKEITGQKLREKKEHLIKDILETKAKVKERLEIVVEKENPFTIPNILCMTRIVMSPYLGYVILQDNYTLALGLVTFAGITDLLDGWIARNWEGQSSKMGSFLDPLADKVLIATLFVSLTWQNLIPLNLTLLIVGRDVALVASAFVIRYMSLPPPRTLSRYFDVTHATAQLAPTFISKVNTAIQLLLVGTTLASPVFGYADHPALHALCAVTAVSTVVSAVSYLVSKDTYKFLKKS
ncbi:probable cardiolipin synthase (CMP-forming) isoform X1 [Plodia interpunctella]|uniref:probable cardiolipin synthase (CMP-forming) isoform X1 n=1 Tax=Plodia interpunctella TaxID=58824 RepID=UPI002368EA1D|nr:probable cardiolipin synthase (CMP-forming) isoform X1 [Plodia interpunctella]